MFMWGVTHVPVVWFLLRLLPGKPSVVTIHGKISTRKKKRCQKGTNACSPQETATSNRENNRPFREGCGRKKTDPKIIGIAKKEGCVKVTGKKRGPESCPV
jgi:hypothetical protein